MDKFIGKLNGVAYTDRKAFYEALKNMDGKDIHSISVNQEYTRENKKENPKKEKEPKTQLVNVHTAKNLDDLFGIFGSFCEALGIENPWKQEVDYRRKPEDIKEGEEIKKENKNTRKYTLKEIIKFYGFDLNKEFDGSERDDLELDRIDQLLSKKAGQFSEMVWDLYDNDELTDIRETFANLYSVVVNESARFEKSLHDIDENLAKYEKAIQALKDLFFKSPVIDEIVDKFKEAKHAFDVTESRNNYCRLLIHYYAELIKVIDTQY